MAEEESKELPGWVPLFTSLTILMCAFFILLVAYSSFDEKKTKAAIGSLRGTFGVSGILGLFPTDESSSPTQDPRDTSEPTQTASMIQKLRSFKRFCESQQGIRVRYNSEGMRIDTAERVLFDLGSAKIRGESEEFLTMVADLVVEGQSHALVEGHCDEADIKATDYDSGWALSINRAMAVTSFFKNAGVEAGRLASYGYGEFNPLSRGENKEDRFNRRVTILIDIGDVASLLSEAEEMDGEKEEASS